MEIPEVVEIDDLDQANAHLGTPLRSTTSLLSALDGRNKKEPATLLKVVISPQNTHRHRMQGGMPASADEARLLGESPKLDKLDPLAIPIPKPSATQGNPPKRNSRIPGGFKPQNTLVQSPNAHKGAAYGSSSASLSSSRRKRNQLELDVSIGSNVKQMSLELRSCVPLAGEPRPKRKKIGSPHDSAKSFDLPGSNRGDISHIRQPQFMVPKLKDQGCENNSRLSKIDGVEDCIEHQKTMDSNKARERYEANGQKTENTESIILQPPDASSVHCPIEIQVHNATRSPSSRPAYKGTARPDPPVALRSGSTARGILQSDSGGKSKYFPQDRGAGRQPRRGQYRDCNGKHRISDGINLSSDELEGGTTVGNHTVVNLASSDKRLRSTSPVKTPLSTSRTLLSADRFDGLAPSTIQSTNFQTGAMKRQHLNHSPPLNVDSGQEETKSWGIGLVSIVGMDGTLIKGPDLGLDFISKQQVYQVQLQGKKQGPGHQIDPKYLKRAIGAEGTEDAEDASTKLRLETVSGEKYDVEMTNHLDVHDLLKHMQGIRLRPLKIDWKSSEWLDNAFVRRKNSGPSRNLRSSFGDEPEDVQMAKINKKRREDAQRCVTTDNKHNPKRQRMRILDEMHGEEFSDGRNQVGPEQISNFQIEDITAANQTSLGQDSFRITRSSDRIHKFTANPHLSGPWAEAHQYARQAKQLFTREQILQSSSFRKPADLGAPWKKPLLFPKDGKKKVSVEFSDLIRLEEAEFLNDNLIGFYLRYLERRLEETKPEIAKKVYFFNTFFFASLTNTQKGKGDINYEAVQNWTRSIDIFAFEYVVVPINESAHWYLAIICNLSAILPGFTADNSSADGKETYSLHSEQHAGDNSISAAILSDQPSTPKGEVASMRQAHSTANKAEEEPDLEDQAPTASFAEMSLDTNYNKGSSVIDPYASNSKASHPKSRAQEQGMLDAQINDDLAQFNAQGFETAPGATEVAEQLQNEEGSFIPPDEKLHNSAKKRKRKSVPPITRRNPASPAIITFDSLGLTHWPTIRTLKNYLREEGKAKRGLEWDDASIKGVTAKDIPEQNNLCDCGLFLLGYVEKFLDNPKEFTSKIIAREYDVEKDWPRLNPSTLRVSIRKQIMDLHEEQQRDRREDARKPENDHGKKPHAGKRGNPGDVAKVEKGREEPRSPSQTPPSLRSSPKLEIHSKRSMGKDEASETTLEKEAFGGTRKPEEVHISYPMRRSRSRSLQRDINPRRGLTRKEALELAIEIGAPEPQMLINSFGEENRQKYSVLDVNSGNRLQKPQLDYELGERSRAATNNGYPENDESDQLNSFHRFNPSPSFDPTDVADHAPKTVEMPSIIEDSQPDASQEILGEKCSTLTAPAAARRADKDIKHGFHRSPPTAFELESQTLPKDRSGRSANPGEQEEKSIIEID